MIPDFVTVALLLVTCKTYRPFFCHLLCLLHPGRDGLTHNMLDNIHSHWKRRRVCKIKCKGVCTVDMDNVRQQLEVWNSGSFHLIVYFIWQTIFFYMTLFYTYNCHIYGRQTSMISMEFLVSFSYWWCDT